ncbi:secretin and TonB N-terminal domain-containing protein [Hymenobacter sp. 15J16-1T3B]|uniref:DUF4974 domain-containing protein n=1 Tax=Hymenobacter sp. 15J16-1T3B TaxID=2886941 RepID=UPI001D10B977|nr:DUF4974 domain-containing protein [Hymenobacter sp. 15J16-1T3B]MCC3155636.1 secretin and TonB N-terminal domain-containing protein [Hymenobacter sp. 15J16-1T3B]
MRNRICLAAAVLCALAGAPAAAQVRTGSVLDRRVTVTFNQAPLESVLRTLRRQYGVRISYSNTALNLRQPVTLNAQNQPLRTVLSEVLEGKNIGYELVGDQLVLHPAPPKPAAAKAATSAAVPAATTTTVSRAAVDKALDSPAATEPKESEARTATPAEPAKPTPASAVPAKAKPAVPTKKTPVKPASGTAAKGSTSGRAASPTSASGKATAKQAGAAGKAAAPKAAGGPAAEPTTVASTAAETPATATPAGQAAAAAATPVAGPPAAGPAVAAADSAAAVPETPAEAERPTFTKPAQISFLGPLGSNGLRSGQTVNNVSINVLGGYAAGVDGFEAAGLVNVDRDTVAGLQVAGLANVVGRHLDGVQAAGLANVLGGPGRGWQAAGLLNLATRPVAGAQTAGLFNFAGPRKRPAEPELTASTAASGTTASGSLDDATTAPRDMAVQAAGLFNVALTEIRGGQAAGLFNVAKEANGLQAAGLFNVAGTVHGVQLAGLVNFADSVQGVSLAPFNFVVHGYHRLELTNSDAWPVTATLKLGGSPAFYTFFTGAYKGFGSDPRRWALGYGVGTEAWARRRFSLSLDAAAMHVNEEQRGLTRDLNLHNQLRLLVGFAPFKARPHLRLIAGPTFNVLVTQRYDSDRGKVYSNISQGRKTVFDEGNARTRVLGWYCYSVGLRF